ncbi:MAG: 4-alpha-glucanotransferase [Zetaproteobacteria bacterium]|nr:MAG: 4-alpha-glucanotransferase [Zetaproteobacteria bacterium]
MSDWIDARRSAVLLHLTSLPGPGASGWLGHAARLFIRRMSEAGFSVWQFLPIGPTHEHGSPYESLSSFAGNPQYIDLFELARMGLLDESTIRPGMGHEEHHRCIIRAAATFFSKKASHPELFQSYETFLENHRDWLDDFALFTAIRACQRHKPWWQWPATLRKRDQKDLRRFARDHEEDLRLVCFEQFVFEHQWQKLKHYAAEQRVLLFGDLPIYVAHDSADVWANPELFTLKDDGQCEHVAGVPPDYFSKTGQRWGNPLYRWDRLERQDFDWWIRRIAHQMARMDLLRIDHFRGLAAYWAIPAERQDGVEGTWHKAPGDRLLAALQKRLGRLPLIAEDLGLITKDVIALRKKYGLPGMKILQFAFDGNPENPYLPEHHEPDAVAYTGTHDNDTTLGWFRKLDEDTRQRVLKHLHCKDEEMPWPLIEAALSSPALLSVIPMQDLLELGSEARFNTPGTLHGNWTWRLGNIPEASAACWLRAAELNRRHGRQLS